MKNLYTALLAAKKEIGGIAKDSENPYFKSKYFDINALIEVVEPALMSHGIVVMQPLSELNGKPMIVTKLIHAESGEELNWQTPLIENPDPQKLGSVITYFRRYALVSLLCLRAEDDDANAASKTKKDVKKPTGQNLASSDVRKATIKKLVDELDKPKTADGYADTIFKLTKLEPDPKNYDEIIERLNVIKSEKA